MCNHYADNKHNLSQFQVSGVDNGSLKFLFMIQKGLIFLQLPFVPFLDSKRTLRALNRFVIYNGHLYLAQTMFIVSGMIDISLI